MFCSGRRRVGATARGATATAIAALALGAVAACGSNGASSQVSSSAVVGTPQNSPGTTATGKAGSTSASLPADVVSRGYITFGQYIDGSPDTFLQGNKLTGWQNELATAVAQSLGVKAKLVPVSSFDAIIPGLQSGRYDASFNSYYMTPERRQVVDFVTVLKAGTGYATASSSNIAVRTEADLCGRQVATLAGSAFVSVLTAANQDCTKSNSKPISVQTYPSEASMALAVTNGRAQIVASGTGEIGSLAAKAGGQLKIQPFVSEEQLEAEAFPKGSKLLQPVRNALNKLIANGEYMKILTKWHVQNGAIQQAEINPPA